MNAENRRHAQKLVAMLHEVQQEARRTGESRVVHLLGTAKKKLEEEYNEGVRIWPIEGQTPLQAAEGRIETLEGKVDELESYASQLEGDIQEMES